MHKCELCGKNFDNINGLSKHIAFSHKELTKEEYYNHYIGISNKICICGSEKKFRNLSVGYLNFCSQRCASANREPLKYWEGKKQPQDMIDKRVKNTDQKSKQKKRENTLLKRYGDKHYNNPLAISEGNKGKTMPRRTNEHSKKIIESKRKNGTLNHSESTRSKIRQKVLKKYRSDDAPVTLSENNGGSSKTGYINDIFFRSSYEKIFIEFCIDKDILIESAENKKFRVRYYDKNNIPRFYYPDFYIPKYNSIIEVKPKSMLTMDINARKINAAQEIYPNFFIVTEDELVDLNTLFEKINQEFNK